MEKPKHFEATIVHGYWPSQKGPNGEFTQGLRGKLNTLAAAIDYHEGRTGRLIITNGQVWGGNYPAVREVMKRDLVETYHVRPKDIVSVGNSLSTGKEVLDGLTIAQRLRARNLGCYAFGTHHMTIPLLVNELDPWQGETNRTITYVSTEDVLRESTNPTLAKAQAQLEWLLASKLERNFIFYELLQWGAIKAGRTRAMMEKAEKSRHQKGKGGIFPALFPIDFFYL